MNMAETASDEFDPLAEAEAVYKRHRKVLETIRKEWEELGCPMTIPFGKQMITHPVLKELHRSEQIANQLLRTMRQARRVGRPKGANSAPDRVAAERLRFVK
jgi:hypothetical protein